MVYRGKPSLGCGTCRRRHIKCDQTRPICLVCQKSGRECLGYRDWGELWVRDQTQEVAEASGDASRRRNERIDELWLQQEQSPNEALSLTDRYALNHFFVNYVQPIQSHHHFRSYFQIMPIVFLYPKPASALEAATLSLAYATYRNVLGGELCMPEARGHYQVALNRLRDAIQSEDSKSNEILLTVLYMQTIEAFTGSSVTETHAESHIDGAIALIKHRGKESFQDEISKKLLLSARGLAVRLGKSLFPQILQALIDNVEQVARDLRRAVTSGAGFAFFPMRKDLGVPFLFEDEEPEDEAPGGNLIQLMSRMARLCDDAQNLLSQPQDIDTKRGIQNLIQRCHDLDENFVNWSHEIPQPFDAEIAMTNEIQHSNSGYSAEGYYWGSFHAYTDLYVARAWNESRVGRLFIQDVRLRCHRWLAASEASTKALQAAQWEIEESQRTSQVLIDWICASVPFCLGYLVALGRHYLFIPLYFAQASEIVGAIQKEWILNQMLQIVHGMGVIETGLGSNVQRELEEHQRNIRGESYS